MDGVLERGDSGIGFTLRFEPSPYRGSDRDYDLLPLFIYDSGHFYLHGNRTGLKLQREAWRAELFLQERLEGFASDQVPTSMTGMARRSLGADLGIGLQRTWGRGTGYGELLQDVSDTSNGTELRLGYRYDAWWRGRLWLRPYATLAFRDARLNNYYYGVRPDEATAERPAYAPGGGVNVELGLLAGYRLSESWQLLGSLGLTRASSAVGASPVVEDQTLPHAMLGLLYGFTPERAPPGVRVPLIVRAYYGASSECDLALIVSLQCTATHTHDNTNLAALELGRRLVERLNDWPLDLAGFVGLSRRYERGLQPDFWQVQAYFKLYYYGFPWRDRLRTRVGFGAGLSYASRIPVSEQRDQAARNGDTSKLLLYADPTVDLNLGDLLRSGALRDTYVGLGVSHRSGLFGWSRLFNNVFGGSNYIYAYLETSL